MGTTLFAARKLLIAQLKENLEMRLMIMSNRISRMTAESTELANQKAQIEMAQMEQLITDGTTNVSVENLKKYMTSTAQIDMEIRLCDLKEEEMDVEVQSLNSQIQSLKAEEEEIDKAEDKAIKNTFGAFANK